ncbi:protein of unknown function [Xenorhabdus bovienii]|uniref:Uncharacterized protein n=1 Tax=Xenorhabdus bovienii TaxID=40576 RepID=A0A0B6XEI5_XENBV|nr:protein of unknown function [Xenorhabdus bovienii]
MKTTECEFNTQYTYMKSNLFILIYIFILLFKCILILKVV